eukprot:gnl/MRDRNA2_/MRDRNA2_115103_c0_seq1.p1 gnl/MRDRNA2_/MRDRNA2_115103_c0~~gnl/MRDRNA2_/MRDRNA2_115103_c0_seq1.p1  ORF type:complete len:398 (+),score=113.34 gnl/MRDRNA2_/MRDRNA2_115103_c0_seq1:78-1271(+)
MVTGKELETPRAQGESEVSAQLLKHKRFLIEAIESKDVQAVELMVSKYQKAGAEKKFQTLLSLADDEGWTPLHYAAHGGTKHHTKMITVLLQAKSDPNQQDNQGWGPLHVAAQFAETDGIKELMEYFANRQAKDKAGRRPVDCANGEERVRLLRRPYYRVEQTMKKVTEGFRMDYFAKRGLPVTGSYKEDWCSEDLVEQYDEEISTCQHDLDLRKEKLDGQMQALQDKVKSREIDPISAAKDFAILGSEQSSLMVEQAGTTQSGVLLKQMKKKRADAALIQALRKVKAKLNSMRAMQVSNPITQTKVNVVGYAYCVEVLEPVLKKCAEDGDENILQIGMDIFQTLLVPLGGNANTPKGFRQKLEAKIDEVLNAEDGDGTESKSKGKKREDSNACRCS